LAYATRNYADCIGQRQRMTQSLRPEMVRLTHSTRNIASPRALNRRKVCAFWMVRRKACAAL